MGSLENLRKEQAELSARLTRFAILTLSAVFLFFLAFVNAMSRIETAAGTDAKLKELYELSNETGYVPPVSYIFRVLRPKLQQHSWKEPIDYGSAEVRRQRQLGAEIEIAAQQWFTAKVRFLGSEFDLDLRKWIIAVPVVAWLSAFYLTVTWWKRSIVRRIGIWELFRAESPEPMDRLAFGDYSRQPALMGVWTFLLSLLSMLGAFTVLALPVSEDVGMALPMMSAMLLTVTLYFAQCGASVGASIERRVASWCPALDGRLLSDRFVEALQGRIRPLLRIRRTTLTTAGAIIAASLLMPVATKTCSWERRRGVDLLFLRDDTAWFSTTGDYFNAFGWTLYAAAVAAALLSLLAVVWLRRHTLRRPTVIMRFVAYLLMASMIVELGVAYPFIAIVSVIGALIWSEPLAGVWAPICVEALTVLATVLWSILALRRRERAQRIVRVLFLLCVPLVPAMLVTLFYTAAHGVWGLMPFTLGLALLAIGWAADHSPGDGSSSGTSVR